MTDYIIVGAFDAAADRPGSAVRKGESADARVDDV
jgi:hypothetical protein